ncbi:hypothetical protein AOQ84DRAFT_352855 [Glonium stellatum]|uniref:Erythromycin esterase n=1 Tax=Glonium stellatum TaxID=574774 RepID=A0A8E2F8B2_9PEZI|nr:hypothetical protein AOQ84DRAFT_352855 [Glonium stellatum]
MAKRRSARLRKGRTSSQSPGPSIENLPSPPTTALNPLPSVKEHDETPNRPTQIPQAVATTPHSEKKSISFLAAITTRTPRNRTPIKPAGEEMHPHHHQASTAKPLDEARWLGFLSKGAHTAPAKGSNQLAVAQGTPTKAQDSTPNPFTTPDFKFRYKRSSMDLSPESHQMMEETRAEAKKIRSQMLSTGEFTSTADLGTRKKAVPKGKTSRFSDIHMAQFKKMDSIANHPSSFRADPNRSKNASTSLKRSPSKAELDTPEHPAKVATISLKRTQSKAELNKSRTGADEPKSTIKLVPSREDEASGPPKRIKRHANDDASATRPVSKDDKPMENKPMTPRGPRPMLGHTGIPRAMSRLYTPTKASLARSQSVKTTKTSLLPSMMRSPSLRAIMSPKAFEGSLKEGLRKTSNSLLRIPGVKSILRTPNQKFSNDPVKIAAGTHMSPPPGLNLNKTLPAVPATAPVRKQVNFTASTVAKSEHEEVIGTPSRIIKARASSEAPKESIVSYPTLPGVDQSPTPSPSRRTTLGDLPGSMPSNFTFRSDKPINFGPATTGTIRQVRSSDAHEKVSGATDGAKKRKLENSEGASDKENREEEYGRANKRTKANPVEITKTPTSKLPRRTEKRLGSLSQARLNLLATPRRKKV